MLKKKIIAFDLDETLCFRKKELPTIERYKFCQPIQKNIDICNKCYEEGFYIKIYTARGINSFNGDLKKIYEKLYNFTINQLKNWNVKYHELIMGKQEYDLLIDDKALNIKEIHSIKNINKFFNA